MLTDEMYEDASLHTESGTWQMIFGVMTAPEEEGRKGIVLTCKTELIQFYEQFGYINEGKSLSKHGNVSWNEMRLLFETPNLE